MKTEGTLKLNDRYIIIVVSWIGVALEIVYIYNADINLNTTKGTI